MMGSDDPYITLTIDGQSLLASSGGHELAPYLSSFSYQSRGLGGDQANVVFQLPDTGVPKGVKLLGGKLEVKMYKGGSPSPVLETTMEILNVSVKRPPCEVNIRAEDRLHHLMKPRDANMKREFNGETIADCVSKIAKDYGLKAKCSSKIPLNETADTNETDHAFLSRIAADFNLVLRLNGDYIVMGDKSDTAPGKLSIDINDIEGVNLTMKTIGLITEVEVYGTEDKSGTVKPLGKAKATDLKGVKGELGTKLLGSSKILRKVSFPATNPTLDKESADKRALGIMAQHTECFVKGGFSSRFNPTLVGGAMVSFKDAGWPFADAEFWIDNVTHSWDAGGIKSSAQFTGAAVGKIAPPGGSFIPISFPSLPF